MNEIGKNETRNMTKWKVWSYHNCIHKCNRSWMGMGTNHGTYDKLTRDKNLSQYCNLSTVKYKFLKWATGFISKIS